MIIYGFTGTQQLSKAGIEFVKRTLLTLPEPDLVVTGGCVGVDAVVGRWYADFTEAKQHVILPAKLKKVSMWFNEYPHVTFEQMPKGTSYMDRNDRLVQYCVETTRLHGGFASWRYPAELKAFAFPAQHREVLRSGTWATVRRFRAAGIEPVIFPLDL